MKKEIRQLTDNINEINDRTISGYAVVFESESEYIGFKETIKRGAITQETIDKSDIFCKLNHNDDKVLARSKYGVGSLKLTINEIGLRYEFEAPCTALGDEVLEYIKRGDITASSFAFTIGEEKGSERWYKDEEGVLHREIFKIKRLYDVSPVFTPAYCATSVECKRALEIAEKSNTINSYLKEFEDEIESW